MPQLIVIGGPTASGKTRLALELAKHYQTEILSADSRQCYQELKIGVARPSEQELHEAKHHFIASHSIHHPIHAAGYEVYGLEILKSLFSKYDTVICVGGTGLYIKALCEGLDEMPEIDPDIKHEMEAQYKELGLLWLQQKIEELDPEYYLSSEKNNPHRLLRALVFKLSTGASIIEFRKQSKKVRPFKINQFYINIDREKLYQQINQRVEHMIELGLKQEVESLISYKNLVPLQTVGYKEYFDYFDNIHNEEQAIHLVKQHTRNYAKRQLTWFKNQANTMPIGTTEDVIKHLKDGTIE